MYDFNMNRYKANLALVLVLLMDQADLIRAQKQKNRRFTHNKLATLCSVINYVQRVLENVD